MLNTLIIYTIQTGLLTRYILCLVPFFWWVPATFADGKHGSFISLISLITVSSKCGGGGGAGSVLRGLFGAVVRYDAQ